MLIPSMPLVADYASGNSLPHLREKKQQQWSNSKDTKKIISLALQCFVDMCLGDGVVHRVNCTFFSQSRLLVVV